MKLKITIAAICISALSACVSKKPMPDEVAVSIGQRSAIGDMCYAAGYISLRDLSDFGVAMNYMIDTWGDRNVELMVNSDKEMRQRAGLNPSICSVVYTTISQASSHSQQAKENAAANAQAWKDFSNSMKTTTTSCNTIGTYTNCTSF